MEKLARDFNVEVAGIGVAAWIKEGEILRAPNLPDCRMPETSLKVVVENDANCFALYAAEKFGFKNMIGITVGTGIGSGIIIDGEIYRGTGLAGEIGHTIAGGDERCVCGGSGHLEAYFGGRALKRMTGMDAEKVFEKDEGLIYSLDGFRMFCKAISFSVMLMDFDAVVIGGRIGMRLRRDVLKSEIYSCLMPEFEPEIIIIDDELAVAKGAAILASMGVEGVTN